MLAPSVDGDVNGGPIGRNWLRQRFKTLNLSFTITFSFNQGSLCCNTDIGYGYADINITHLKSCFPDRDALFYWLIRWCISIGICTVGTYLTGSSESKLLTSASGESRSLSSFVLSSRSSAKYYIQYTVSMQNIYVSNINWLLCNRWLVAEATGNWYHVQRNCSLIFTAESF